MPVVLGTEATAMPCYCHQAPDAIRLVSSKRRFGPSAESELNHVKTTGWSSNKMSPSSRPWSPSPCHHKSGHRQPTEIQVVEFHHAGIDHNFVTADPFEIAILDAGILSGRARTGYGFGAFSQESSDRRAEYSRLPVLWSSAGGTGLAQVSSS